MFDVKSMKEKVAAEIEKLGNEIDNLTAKRKAAKAVYDALDAAEQNIPYAKTTGTRPRTGARNVVRDLLGELGHRGAKIGELREDFARNGVPARTVYNTAYNMASLKLITRANGRFYLNEFAPRAAAAE